jgi:4-hydroxybenzoate polyprenyltransferase
MQAPPDVKPELPRSAAARWWAYQRERFPVFAHGPLIAAFSFSAVCFSALLRAQTTGAPPSWPAPAAAVVAFGTALLFFLQLRIADEFKDFDEDARYRPYRPVQRGLVTLKQLGILGVICGVIQLGLALWLHPPLVLLLAVVWVYLALMSKEFFVGDWLRAHPVAYMLSHMIILPLIDFYATACDWWPAQGSAPAGLEWFIAASYFNGLVIEIGRKSRAPADEEKGVNTYTVLWGRTGAALAWLGAMLVSATCGTLAAAGVGFVVPVAALLAVPLVASALTAWWFVRDPAPGRGKRIELMAGVWTIFLYLSVGAVPLAWRWWTAHPEGSP